MLRGAYKLALLSRLAATGTNPWRYVRDYKTARGMNFHNDVHDWLGGFPYESATPDEVTAQFAALGFDPVVEKALPRSLGLFGTGCAEYTFRRR
jgi:2-polyprenyl-6-hydroxyphenyl methylase/3-demethylubiquinone-9 3-methyltransferase